MDYSITILIDHFFLIFSERSLEFLRRPEPVCDSGRVSKGRQLELGQEENESFQPVRSRLQKAGPR